MQYPDTIEITKAPEFVQDEDHNFKPSGEGTVVSLECRAEVAGNNPVITGADGNKVEYSWIVYMPLTSEEFHFGDEVKITKGGREFSSTVKQQYNGQFNTRIWV